MGHLWLASLFPLLVRISLGLLLNLGLDILARTRCGWSGYGSTACRMLEQDTSVSNLAVGCEPDALLVDLDLDGFTERGKITADSSEFGGAERDRGVVLGVGDTEMLLINVHQLHVVLADSVRV